MSFNRLAPVFAALCVACASGAPCCQKCELPKVKVFSTDAPHGFCGEACMDPKHIALFHHFEANLTLATDEHPCREQWTPDNKKQYTDYLDTVTHGVGPVSVTLDLYEPTDMPAHACCNTPIVQKIGCRRIFGRPTTVFIDGTGPFCCPEDATSTNPCSNETVAHGSELMV
mmetsp:Transcript_24209/g.45716  ORF Transcript_24209/g.45716 Transcript_24209/m.45716 type:complete len:171 (-) Transcript_24209:106-618(-)